MIFVALLFSIALSASEEDGHSTVTSSRSRRHDAGKRRKRHNAVTSRDSDCPVDGDFDNYITGALTLNTGKWADNGVATQEVQIELNNLVARYMEDATCQPAFVAISTQEHDVGPQLKAAMAEQDYVPHALNKGYDCYASRHRRIRNIPSAGSMFSSRKICIYVFSPEKIMDKLGDDVEFKVKSQVSTSYTIGLAKGYALAVLKFRGHVWMFAGAHFAAQTEHYNVRRVQFEQLSNDILSERKKYGNRGFGKKSIGEINVMTVAMGDWNTRFHRKPIQGGEAQFYGDIRESTSLTWSKEDTQMEVKLTPGTTWGITFEKKWDTFVVTAVQNWGAGAIAGVEEGMWVIKAKREFVSPAWRGSQCISSFCSLKAANVDTLWTFMMQTPTAATSTLKEDSGKLTLVFQKDTTDSRYTGGIPVQTMKYDGLNRIMCDEDLVVAGWTEAAGVSFSPTYKIFWQGGDREQVAYPLQTVSWTDRIMLNSFNPRKVTTIKYWSLPGPANLDHIPVGAIFRLGRDWANPPTFDGVVPPPPPPQYSHASWKAQMGGCQALTELERRETIQVNIVEDNDAEEHDAEEDDAEDEHVASSTKQQAVNYFLFIAFGIALYMIYYSYKQKMEGDNLNLHLLSDI